MKKFGLAATRGMPVIASASGRPTTRKGLLARIVELVAPFGGEAEMRAQVGS